MMTKGIILALCLLAAVYLSEARSVKQEKASNPDIDLTTVRLFYFVPYKKSHERRGCCVGEVPRILFLGTK
jgi:hypothetical protein